MAYRLVRDDLMLIMVGDTALPEHEWSEYVLQVASASERLRATNKPLRFICFADDASPSAKQRASLMDALGGLRSQTAVITTSALARNVITVFSWLGVSAKGFSPTAVQAAAEHLDLPPAYLEQALDAARALAPTIAGGIRSFETAEQARHGRKSSRA